jgi:hypothetical protein
MLAASFAMTCGVVVPVDGELMEDTLFGNMALPITQSSSQ